MADEETKDEEAAAEAAEPVEDAVAETDGPAEDASGEAEGESAQPDDGGDALIRALFECYSENGAAYQPYVAEYAVLSFAVGITHALMYEVSAFAKEQGQDPNAAAIEWLVDHAKVFTDEIVDEERVRRIGTMLQQPSLGLRLDRAARRRIQGR